jgi:hypothetical protein
MYVPIMLRDPHVWYGMELLKGPIISKAKYTVESDDAEVMEYVDRQIKNFWSCGIAMALDCLAWGYCSGEIIYEFNESLGTIDYKDFKFIHQQDVKAVTKDGELVAVQIKRARKNSYCDMGASSTNEWAEAQETYLRPPKCVWFVHDKKYNRWYGRSRLEGAFDSWWEMWMPKGFRGIRHSWFYNYAYSGGVLYYPDGSTQDPETGDEIPNSVIAQELLDRKETGSSLALPNKTGDNRDWEWEEPSGNKAPEGLMEYGEALRDEMWEGIGVPPEVAKQEDGGSFAGRRVPQQAFYSFLQEIANDICFSFDEQVIKPLVKLAFGSGIDYKIVPISILQTLQEEEMGLVSGEVGEAGMEEEQEFDEEGNPIETEEDPNAPPTNPSGIPGVAPNPSGNKKPQGGKLEDRNSNAFNLKEKALSNDKKKRGKK